LLLCLGRRFSKGVFIGPPKRVFLRPCETHVSEISRRGQVSNRAKGITTDAAGRSNNVVAFLIGVTTKREVVELALRELVRMRTTKVKLKAAKGKLKWEGDLRKLRASRV